MIEAIRAIAPDADADLWADALERPMAEAAIGTPLRVAAFLGQVAEESGRFTMLEERLGYSAPRLMVVWPARFPSAAKANQYAMRPEKLANHVYAGRMGNGDEASGDGWRFRGRGLIQLTGRGNYAKFARDVGMRIETAAEWCGTPDGAAASACWYWTSRGINALADAWDIAGVTRTVNGGLTNLVQRVRYSDLALVAIGAG